MKQTNLNINSLISENKNKDFNKKREISLERFLTVLKNKKKISLIIFFSVFGIINIHTFYMRIFNPIFLGEFSLLISDPLTKIGKTFNPLDPNYLENLALGNTRNDIPTLIEFLKSSFILDPVADEFNLNKTKLQKKINIIPNLINESSAQQEYAGILKIEYLSKSPRKDINFLEYLSKHFIKSAKTFKQQQLTDGLNFLAEQEPELQNKVNDIQNKIKIFRENNSIIKPIAEGEKLKEIENKYIDKIRELDENYNNLINIKNEIKNGRYFITGFKENIVSGDNKSYLTSAGLNISTSYQTLLDEFNNVEDELSSLRATFKPDSKIILSYEKRSESIKPILKKYQLDAVEAALSFNRSSRISLEEQRLNVNKKFKMKPKLIKEYDSLVSRLNVLDENFTSLIEAKEQFQLQLAKDNLSWKIIEPPKFTDYPIYPSIRRRLISSIMLGIFSSFIIAFYLESKNNYFDNDKEIKNRFSNFTYLGTLNFIKNLEDIFKNIGLAEFYSSKNKKMEYEIKKTREVMRNIFTALKTNLNNQNNVLLITSSQTQEGKSLFSILLSLTIADLNSKVLLIDADLRKPKINDYFKIKSKYGLSDYLSSSKKNLNELILKINNYPSLDYIASGSKVKDPIKLITSSKFIKLMNDLKSSNKYNYILLNSTPILGISDSLILSEYADKIIKIISMKNASKDTVYESMKLLTNTINDYPLIVGNNLYAISQEELEDENKYLEYYIQ